MSIAKRLIDERLQETRYLRTPAGPAVATSTMRPEWVNHLVQKWKLRLRAGDNRKQFWIFARPSEAAVNDIEDVAHASGFTVTDLGSTIRIHK